MDDGKTYTLKGDNEMSVLSKADLLDKIKTRLGDDSSDDALALIEDVTDTFGDLETKAKGDGTDWKAKYEENDKAWRERYKSRFFDGAPEGGGNHSPVDPEPLEPEDATPQTFDELFE